MFGTLRANLRTCHNGGFTDKHAIEVLMASGATLVLSILVIMSSLGNACKDALNDDKDVKQYCPRDERLAKTKILVQCWQINA